MLIDQPIVDIEIAFESLADAAKATEKVHKTGNKLLIVVYYSGHGVIYANRTHGQAGSFDIGDYIPIEQNTKKMGRRANTFVLTLFDGCREISATKGEAHDSSDLKSVHGHYWLMFATKEGGLAISNPPLSDFTKKVTEHFNRIGHDVSFPDHLIMFPYVHGENT